MPPPTLPWPADNVAQASSMYIEDPKDLKVGMTLRQRARLSRPINQNTVVGLVLFCCPGIYLALTGLGAGGGKPSSTQVGSLTNAILYGVYFVAGWLAGTVLNFLKPKLTIALGALGYPIYLGGLWYFDRTGKSGFALAGGAILGVTAALLWTTSGFIQFAYAEEKDKAKYITYQWVLTTSGSTLGAIIAFGVTHNKQEATGVSAGVYATFVVIQTCAIIVDLLLIVHPKDVVRDDGRHIAIFREPSLRNELKGLWYVLADPKILILWPAMFVGEMCLALVSSINAYYFNLRTRSLNNILFQAIMIPAPLVLSFAAMDNQSIKSRRRRGLIGAGGVGVLTLAVYGGLLGWIIKNDIDRTKPPPGVDWTSDAFAAGIILYIIFGIIYACFQIATQWTLGALSNDPSTCARYAGAFKGTVSLGMCISFVIDSQGINYKKQTIIQLLLYALGLACLLYVNAVYVKETNYFAEEDVIVPAAVEEKLAHVGIEESVTEVKAEVTKV